MPSVEDSVDRIAVEDLSPEDLKKLYAEIGVTQDSLERDAAALRAWLNAEPHLPNITSDHDKWLEMFLIASKNSMEKAKQRLDNYFTNRGALCDWFVLPPPPEDEIVAYDDHFMIGGYMPKLLPGGNVLFMESAQTPPDKDWAQFDMNSHFRRALLHTDAFVGRCKPIRGVVYFMDQKNVNMNVASTFISALGQFRKFVSCVQGAMPFRIQAIHLVNAAAPNLQRMLLSAVKPLLSDKLGERIFIHDNFETLHDCIPKECLPKEYGGTHSATLEVLNSNLANFILSKNDWYKSRAWLKSDEDRRLVKKASDNGLEGSFRKLSVD